MKNHLSINIIKGMIYQISLILLFIIVQIDCVNKTVIDTTTINNDGVVIITPHSESSSMSLSTQYIIYIVGAILACLCFSGCCLGFVKFCCNEN